MRKLVGTLAVFCTIALALVYAFGSYLSSFWQKFGISGQVQGKVRLYLIVGALFFAFLYFVKKVIVIVILLVVVVLLFLLHYFDIIHFLDFIG